MSTALIAYGVVLIILVIVVVILLSWKPRPKTYYTHRVFYSEKDNRLFYISTYSTNETNDLKLLRTNLNKGEEIIRQFVKSGSVTCGEILDSKRFKHMWYFSIMCKPEKIPGSITRLKHFTMWEYIAEA